VGPDDAVHAEHGIFMMWDPKEKRGKRLEGLTLYDVSPTVLSVMGIDIPEDMEGKAIQL
jgi:predicted AlkP superfamily phosphohydrolase/phosphomutase